MKQFNINYISIYDHDSYEIAKVLNTYSDQEANLDRGENHTEKGSHASNEIEFINLPYQNCCVVVNQADDS